MIDPAREIERIRTLRTAGRKTRDLSITSLLTVTSDQAQRTHKRLGSLIDLWEELLPADLATHTSIIAFRGGTVHVEVDSAATAYELDRHLREGLLAKLRSRYPGTLARVRVKQGMNTPANDRKGSPRQHP